MKKAAAGLARGGLAQNKMAAIAGGHFRTPPPSPVARVQAQNISQRAALAHEKAAAERSAAACANSIV